MQAVPPNFRTGVNVAGTLAMAHCVVVDDNMLVDPVALVAKLFPHSNIPESEDDWSEYPYF